MAVRHGYGKIAGTDALVFAYDTGDTRNSYKGEPTENIRASSGLDSSYSDTGRTIDNSGTLTAPDGTTGWSSISSPGSNSNYRIAKFTYNSLTANTTYTFSLELYNPGPNALEIFVDGNAGYAGTTIPLGYSKWTYTITRASSSTQAIFFGAENKTANATYSPERLIYFKNYQVEQKSHATPFIAGTRSATEGLKDLTGNNSISLSNVSFDSNAQMTFDGTGDYADLSDQLSGIDTSILSVEMVFKSTETNTSFRPLLGINSDQTNTGYICLGNFTGHWSNESLSCIFVNSSGTTFLSFAYTAGSSTLKDNQYHHIVFNFQTDNYKIFVDGEEVAVNASFRNGSQSTTMISNLFNTIASPNVTIGHAGSASNAFLGDIPITKIYNRALTADEVRNNYRHYKKRFNI